MKDENGFKPFIAADRVVPEFTVVSIVLGVLLAVLFGAANAYLGLRVGMTVSASIPAAVISMGVIRLILRRESILENNMVQTIGSAGESVAAGAIFTLPAMFMWMSDWNEGSPSLMEIALIALCGGALGVLFMIPLRQALIVKEHGTLPYPEGTACAEVLLAGEEGGSKAATVFQGLGLAALYKFIADGVKLFPSEVHYEIESYKGAGVGISVLPALAGVGYICGTRISSYMLCGGIISWMILMPLISLFGGDAIIFPATEAISTMTSQVMWSKYIRYIGAGAVAAGGIMSLVKSLPLIVRTFGDAMKSLKGRGSASGLRTEQDMPMIQVLILIAALIVTIWLAPVVPVTLIGAVIIAVFGFFFATVSARLVGLVGSSNNPVSGMAIATLLISALIMKGTSGTGHQSMLGVIAIGSVICIIAAIAGDTSQDLKTGFIVGATPRRQQYGELIGVVASALAIGGVLYLLNAAWGYGSDELPAPQAMIMKLVVEGVMDNNLPWTLILAGAGIAVVIEILRIPVMPVAVGMYLPIHTSTAIMVGGLIRGYFEKRKMKEDDRKDAVERGILYTSGMIAGEGLIGILLAVFAVIPFGKDAAGEPMFLGDWLGSVLSTTFGLPEMPLGKIGALVVFALLMLSICKVTIWRKRESK